MTDETPCTGGGTHFSTANTYYVSLLQCFSTSTASRHWADLPQMASQLFVPEPGVAFGAERELAVPEFPPVCTLDLAVLATDPCGSMIARWPES